jgi:hypothetical protein
VLQFRLIGTTPAERTVGEENVINVQLRRVAQTLDAVVTRRSARRQPSVRWARRSRA